MTEADESGKPAAAGAFSVDAIAEKARAKARQIADAVPDSGPLQEVCAGIAEAAEKARRRIRRMKGPFSLGRIRLYLVILAAAGLIAWVYSNFLAVREIRIAVPASDSVLLKERALRSGSRHVTFVECRGSTEGKRLVQSGQVDFTVIQGGVEIPNGFDVIGIVRFEHVMYFEREALPPRGTPPRVVTFNPGQGSHLLGRLFFAQWGYPEVEWIHAWSDLSAEGAAPVPEAHAAFVVVDPSDPSTMRGVRALARAGYRLRDPYLGAHQAQLPFLRRKAVPTGYYHVRDPIVPAPEQADFQTYAVENYLVASPSVTEWQRSETLRGLRMLEEEGDLPSHVFHTPGTSVVGDLANMVEATVNLVIILVALFGLEVIFHRKYLHELNTLISRISLLQAEKDLAGLEAEGKVRQHLKYLDVCADLLGLISSIAGHYGKEDASLLFGGLTGTIHTRANQLMINIQLKLLQGRRGA